MLFIIIIHAVMGFITNMEKEWIYDLYANCENYYSREFGWIKITQISNGVIYLNNWKHEVYNKVNENRVCYSLTEFLLKKNESVYLNEKWFQIWDQHGFVLDYIAIQYTNYIFDFIMLIGLILLFYKKPKLGFNLKIAFVLIVPIILIFYYLVWLFGPLEGEIIKYIILWVYIFAFLYHQKNHLPHENYNI